MGRVLVTGVGSYVGASIAQGLVLDGYRVIGLVRSPSPFTRALRGSPGIEFCEGDLCHPDLRSRLPLDVDAVVNCAAAAPNRPMRALIEDNVVATERLLDLALSRSFRAWVQFSSVSVHGEITGGILGSGTRVVNPSPYGATKLLADLILSESASEIAVRVLRLPAILGGGATGHWLSRVLRSARAGDDIGIVHPTNLFNNAIHLADLRRLVSGLLNSDLTGFDAFPVASREPAPVAELVRAVVDLTNSESVIEVISNGGSSFTIDDEYARSRYGYESMTIREAVRQYVVD